VAHKGGENIMGEIKENGYGKGLVVVLIAILTLIFGIYLHVDSRMLTKDTFAEFKEHVMMHLVNIQKELRRDYRGGPGGG